MRASNFQPSEKALKGRSGGRTLAHERAAARRADRLVFTEAGIAEEMATRRLYHWLLKKAKTNGAAEPQLDGLLPRVRQDDVVEADGASRLHGSTRGAHMINTNAEAPEKKLPALRASLLKQRGLRTREIPLQEEPTAREKTVFEEAV